MIKLAYLYTETGHFVAVVEVPPVVAGYPPVLERRGRIYLQDPAADSTLYHEVFGLTVVHAREFQQERSESMPTYMGKTVSDAYLKSLLEAYREGYTTAGGQHVEDSDQPILDALEANGVMSPKAPSAWSLGEDKAREES